MRWSLFKTGDLRVVRVPKVWEIWLATIHLRKCEDRRPCLIIEAVSDGLFLTVPLSAQMDLFDGHRHFLIPASHVDFEKTGLTRSSYLIGDELRELSARILRRHLGDVTGTLRSEIQGWLG